VPGLLRGACNDRYDAAAQFVDVMIGCPSASSKRGESVFPITLVGCRAEVGSVTVSDDVNLFTEPVIYEHMESFRLHHVGHSQQRHLSRAHDV